ncbi:hypothetical protein MHLNE_11040 [Moorella humiferrea]|uniref:DUF362 domain-containing protein n=1 Tax=Neomoorella humiferrea TaxID=676965 RepID=UPI0030CC17DA
MSKEKNIVSIVKSTYENVYENLARGIELTGGLDILGRKRIVVKINICDARTPETGAITHPKFLDAFLRYLRDHYPGVDIFVVESDATVVLADDFIQWFGLAPVIEKWNAKWVNLSLEDHKVVRINGYHLKEVPLASIFEDSFFVTLPKLKTNVLSSITCCLKNQFGCFPLVQKSIYHTILDKVIADVNLVYRPDFCIVDGIVTNAGTKGPAFGTPIPAQLIVCGRDPVAVDTVCAKIMGFNPWFIGHIRKAAALGVGKMKYTLRGVSIKDAKMDFEINKLEMRLLKFASRLQRSSQKEMRQEWKN